MSHGSGLVEFNFPLPSPVFFYEPEGRSNMWLDEEWRTLLSVSRYTEPYHSRRQVWKYERGGNCQPPPVIRCLCRITKHTQTQPSYTHNYHTHNHTHYYYHTHYNHHTQPFYTDITITYTQPSHTHYNHYTHYNHHTHTHTHTYTHTHVHARTHSRTHTL